MKLLLLLLLLLQLLLHLLHLLHQLLDCLRVHGDSDAAHDDECSTRTERSGRTATDERRDDGAAQCTQCTAELARLDAAARYCWSALLLQWPARALHSDGCSATGERTGDGRR